MLKIGIVGLDALYMHGVMYAQVLRDHPDARLVGVSGNVSDSLIESFAKRFGVKLWDKDYHKIINNPEIDAVMACNHPGELADACITAAEAGKHVSAGKGMCMTLEEADKIRSACRRADVKLQVNFAFRFRPVVQKCIELMKQGVTGVPKVAAEVAYEPSAVEEQDEMMVAPEWPVTEWLYDPKKSVGGAFWWFGWWAVDIMRKLLQSEVKSVKAEMGTYIWDMPVDDFGAATFMFENGVRYNFQTSFHQIYTRDPKENPRLLGGEGFDVIVINGTEGDLILQTRGSPKIRVAGKKALELFGRPFWLEIPRVPAAKDGWLLSGQYDALLDDFVECIIRDREPMATFEDGYATLKAILAAYESAKRHEEIKL